MSVVDKFRTKDSEIDAVITYHCPLMEEDFFFRESTLADEQIIINVTKGMSESDSLIATYLYYNCDSSGQRLEDYKDKEVRKQLRKSTSFSTHCVEALKFTGQHNPKDKDDNEDGFGSDPSEVARAKKPSSETTNAAS